MSLRYFPEGGASKWYESGEAKSHGDFKWTCLILAIVMEKFNLLDKYNI